jgi:diacylglycerol kinase family enzyme
MSSDLAAALQQLRDAEPRRIDVGRANGRLFLHHVAFGLQPRMVRIRERMGYSSRFTKMLAAVRASVAVLLNPQSQRLGLGIDGQQVELRTTGLIVSNNVYENAMMLKQARLDEGVLGIYAIAPMSILAFLRLAIDVLRGRWRDNVHVKELRGSKVRLIRHRRLRRDSISIKATMDGELTLLDLPLDIASDPAALAMLMPVSTSA